MKTAKTKTQFSLKKNLKKIYEDKVLYALLFPTMLYFVIFRIWPIINMRLAVYDYKAFGEWKYVGSRKVWITTTAPRSSSVS